MIPVIVGAVALAAGAGVGFALGKNDKPEQVIVKKAEVSEDYVKWCAERAGKNIETNTQAAPPAQQSNSSSGMKFIPSGDFSADFEKIENMLASPNVSNEFISEALYAIEGEARRKSFQGTLILVGNYREKLRKWRR